MMGLCKSCFSTKYYGTSPGPGDGDTGGQDQDTAAQMLIVKSSSNPALVSSEPVAVVMGVGAKDEDEETRSLIRSSEKLARSETGDSGTCVDHDSFAKLEAGKGGSGRGESSEENIATTEDLVQLTVSSVASLGAVVPTLTECGDHAPAPPPPRR